MRDSLQTHTEGLQSFTPRVYHRFILMFYHMFIFRFYLRFTLIVIYQYDINTFVSTADVVCIGSRSLLTWWVVALQW